MTEYEAYQEHIRYTHDTYCRIVIRHASFDAARMLAARWKPELGVLYGKQGAETGGQHSYCAAHQDKSDCKSVPRYGVFPKEEIRQRNAPADWKIQDYLEKPERAVLPLRNADGCNGRKRNLLPCTKGKGWHGRCSQYALRSLHLSAYLC